MRKPEPYVLNISSPRLIFFLPALNIIVRRRKSRLILTLFPLQRFDFFVSTSASIGIAPDRILRTGGINPLPPFPGNRVLTSLSFARTDDLARIVSDFLLRTECFVREQAQAGSWQSTRTHVKAFFSPQMLPAKILSDASASFTPLSVCFDKNALFANDCCHGFIFPELLSTAII
jgi:hypothetical protein